MSDFGFRRRLTQLLTACLVTALAACTTIKPAAPQPVPVPPLPPVADSSIAVPINIDTVALGHELEALLSAQPGPQGIFWITGDHLNGNVDLQMGVNRTGPAIVTTDGGCLNFSVPLGINNGRIDAQVHVLIANPRKVVTFGGAVNVKTRACVAVDHDWHVESTVVPAFEWTTDPFLSVSLPIGNITIGIRDRVTSKLQEKLPMIQDLLQRKLAAIDVTPAMAKAWEGLQRPLQLSTNPDVTASVDVMAVGLGPMTSSGVNLVIRPSIVAKLSAHIGTPAVAVPARPLPPNSGQAAADGFALALRVDATYDEMNRALAARVANHEFPVADGKHVTLTDVHLSNLGDKLLIKAGFKAKLGSLPFENVEGWLYLTGRPNYDDAARVLSVQGLDFDLDTNKVLLDAGAAVLKPYVIEQLTKAAVFELAKEIDPVKSRISAGIEAREIWPGLVLNVTVSSFDVSTLHVDDTGVAIFTTARGMATLDVGNLLH